MRTMNTRISSVFTPVFRHPLLLFVAVLFAVTLYVASAQAGLDEIENPWWILTMGALILIPPFFDGLFIRLVHGLKTGKPLVLRAAIASILPCYGRLVMIGVLVSLGVLLGVSLFLVPGIYLGMRWIFYRQGIVLDGAGGVASLRISIERTRGWRAIVSLICSLAIVYTPTFIIVYAVLTLPLGRVGDVLVIAASALTFAWVNTLLTDLYLRTGAATGERGKEQSKEGGTDGRL